MTKHAPIVTKTEARQGQRVGLIRVLVASMSLALVAGMGSPCTTDILRSRDKANGEAWREA